MTKTGELKVDGTLNKLRQKKETINPDSVVDPNAAPPAKKPAGATFADFLKKDSIQLRFHELMQNRAPQFLTSILALYNNDAALRKADPVSIVQSAMIAASLDLPIEKNFGYAWIIPYKNWKTNETKAQFQMGYKGYIQLALRSGQYEKINVITVYEGQLVDWDDLTENFVYDRTQKKSDKVIGYAAFFKLLSGFVKTVYWTKEEVERHRIEFNKAKNPEELSGAWASNYNAMAMKVVLNNLLKKWGILSVDLRTAIIEEEKDPEKERNIIDLDEEGYTELEENEGA